MAALEQSPVRAFVERHPWPAEMREQGAPLEWLWSFDVEAPIDALWRHVSDTSRFNRALGLGRMHLEEKDGVLHGVAVNGGFRQEWVEEPWTWVAGRMMTTVRRYSRGFARVVRAIIELEARGEGQLRVWVYFGWIPRGLLGRVMLTLSEGWMRSNYGRVLGELAREAREARPPIFRLPPPVLAEPGRAKLRTVCEQLRGRGLPAAAVDRLAEHIAGADELDLHRLQVRALARSWGVGERELLRVALHATRLGLLRMSWDVVCPHCRGVRQELDLLAEVPSGGRCEVCEVDFGTGDPNSIEITFHVHPSVREVQRQHYCSAEPATKAHIKVQQAVAGGETRVVQPRLGPGRYRLRRRGAPEVTLVDVDAAAEERALVWRASSGAEAERVGPDPTIRMINDEAEAATFVVEEARWSDDALRPGHLLGNRDFRDLFTEHFLAAEVQLAVGEQVILFTDMVGSTRFYSEQGDAAAFVAVRDHFTALSAVYDEAGGALIKTIGDATMAVFAEPVAALRAAAAIQRLYHPGRMDTAVRLRISLHRGPCIAVKLNAAIDYFGGTVNAAAKLQACAGAGQVAMSPAIVDAPGVRELLAAEGARIASVPFTSEAFAGEIAVTRWDVWSAGE